MLALNSLMLAPRGWVLAPNYSTLAPRGWVLTLGGMQLAHRGRLCWKGMTNAASAPVPSSGPRLSGMRLAAVITLAALAATEPAPRANAQGSGIAGAQRALRLIDSVRIRETDALFVGRASEITVGPGGHLFVSDDAEGRILEIGPGGQIVRTFGKRGRGPGELSAPGAALVFGDSVLLVMDNGTRHASTFNLRTAAFDRAFALSGYVASQHPAGPEFYVAALDLEAKTSMIALSLSGEHLRTEGTIPDIALKLPALAQLFRHAAVATDGADVYAAFEISQSIFHWKDRKSVG